MPLLSFSILLLSFPQWADLLLISRLDSRSRGTSPRLRLKAGAKVYYARLQSVCECTRAITHTQCHIKNVYQTDYRVLDSQ